MRSVVRPPSAARRCPSTAERRAAAAGCRPGGSSSRAATATRPAAADGGGAYALTMARRSRSGRTPPRRPPRGPSAFASTSRGDHVRAQAATFLLIGSHLRRDPAALEARAAGAGAGMRRRARQRVQAIPAADLRAIGFPAMRADASRFAAPTLQRAARVSFARLPGGTPTAGDARLSTRSLRRVAASFYRNANPETAAAVLEVGLRHPQELARVAAAASYAEVAIDPRPAFRILH